MSSVGGPACEDDFLESEEISLDVNNLGVNVREERGHDHHVICLHAVSRIRVLLKLQLDFRGEGFIGSELVVCKPI